MLLNQMAFVVMKCGAMTLNQTAISRMQSYDCLLRVLFSHFTSCSAVCHNAEHHYSECRSGKCHCA